MNVKEFAAQLRTAIVGLSNKGRTIDAEALVRYLDEVLASPNPEPTQMQIEEYKARFQADIEHRRAASNSNLEMFKSVVLAGQGALRTSFLLNGGASVALLAFIGHLAEIDPSSVPDFAVCLLLFAIGVLVVTITSGLTYLSQWFYGSDKECAQSAGFATNVVCIVLGFTSYFVFFGGLVVTYFRFLSFGSA